MCTSAMNNVITLHYIVPSPGHGFLPPTHGFPSQVYLHHIPFDVQVILPPSNGVTQPANVFRHP